MLNSSFIIDLFSELNVEASNADKVLGKAIAITMFPEELLGLRLHGSIMGIKKISAVL